jgi:hypothetical protein
VRSASRGRRVHFVKPHAFLLVALLAVGLGDVRPAVAALPVTQAAAPESYWKEVPGGPGTMCGTGGRFSFWVHGENPRHFLILLGAGGGCWNPATCGGGRPTTDFTSDLSDFPARTGILAARADNPLRGYSVILIPYCTGDVHLGTREVTYGHNGRNNARAALKWAFRVVKDPAVVVVAGVGAGAIASPMVAELVAEHYPNTRVVQLGNGTGGFRAAAIPGILENWGVPTAMRESGAYQDLDSTQVTFETLYTAFRHPAPNLHLAQINSASDSTQLRFLSQMGVTGMPLEVLMRKNLDDIRTARPEFRSYVLPGKLHTVLLSAGFYATYVDTIRLRDWVANLVEGKDVHDVGSRFLDVPEPVLATPVDSLHAGIDSLHVGAAPVDSLHLGHAAPTDSLHAAPAAPHTAVADSLHAPADSLSAPQPHHAPQDPAHR